MRHRPTAWLATFALAITTVAPAMAEEGHGLLPATPEVTTGAWHVSEERELTIDGELVALSPDGQWIAGIGPEDEFCVWGVESGDATCDQPVGRAIDPRSITWAPDSSAVAYTGDALMRLEDTDILVFALATGTTTNLTDDGYEGSQVDPGDDASAMPVDVFPAWTPDSAALVFARTDRMLQDQQPTDLMTISRTGGDPTFLYAANPTLPLSVNSPILVLGDGTILFVVSSHEIGDAANGIWRLTPDGEASRLMTVGPTAPFPVPALVDVNESANGIVVSGFSRAPADIFAPFSFELDIATGEVTPGTFDPATGAQSLSWTYAPDGESALAFIVDPFGNTLVVRGPDGIVSTLVELEPPQRGPSIMDRGLDWAMNDTIFVPHADGGGTLFTVALG